VSLQASSGAWRDLDSRPPLRDRRRRRLLTGNGLSLSGEGDQHSLSNSLGGHFTLDGEAVVVAPEGLSRFKLRRREAARTVVLYAFDPIEHDGEDLCDLRSSQGRVGATAAAETIRN